MRMQCHLHPRIFMGNAQTEISSPRNKSNIGSIFLYGNILDTILPQLILLSTKKIPLYLLHHLMGFTLFYSTILGLYPTLKLATKPKMDLRNRWPLNWPSRRDPGYK